MPERTNPYAVQSRQVSRGRSADPRNESGTRINTLAMNSTRLGSASGAGSPIRDATPDSHDTLLEGTSAEGLSRTNARNTRYAASRMRAARRWLGVSMRPTVSDMARRDARCLSGIEIAQPWLRLT